LVLSCGQTDTHTQTGADERIIPTTRRRE